MKTQLPLHTRNSFFVAGREIYPRLGKLSYKGNTIKIEPKVMQVLVALAEVRGALLSREELSKRVWKDEVVTEDSLSRTIYLLRKVFNDDKKNPKIIETISTKGYRLIPEVITAESTNAAASKKLSSGKYYIAAAVITMLMIVFYTVEFTGRGVNRLNGSDFQIITLTSEPGIESYPSFSPDGNTALYVKKDASQKSDQIFLKDISSGKVTQLTFGEGNKRLPRFSFDGKSIAFIKRTEAGGGIFRISASGGDEEKLIGTYSPNIYGFDWSNDENLLVFNDRPSAEYPFALFTYNLETKERRQLTFPPDHFSGDGKVFFSPDEKRLAFKREKALGTQDIYVLDLVNNATERVTFDDLKIHGFDWSKDSESIIYSSNRNRQFTLWKTNIKEKSTEMFPLTIVGVDEPQLSVDGKRLVFEQWNQQTNVYSFAIAYSSENENALRKIISSTRWDWNAQVSPDGKSIVFVSDRTGSAEIWMTNSNGSNAKQLTNFNGPYVTMPQWSPDSKHIVFDARPEGHSDIYEIDSRDGKSRVLVSGDKEEIAPFYSRNSAAVYFSSNRTGAWEIWQKHLETGQVSQVTKKGAYSAKEALEEGYFYITKKDRRGIYTLSLSTGEEALLIPDLEPVDWSNWIVTGEGIYFVKRRVDHAPAISFYNHRTKAVTDILFTPKLLYKSGLSITPDNKNLIVTMLDVSESDIILIENRRGFN